MEKEVELVLKLIHLGFTVFLQKIGYSETDADNISNRIGWGVLAGFMALLVFVTIKYGT
ncbi:hypothetical protein EDE11_11179 [Methylomonas methanica]|uniref:Uncharacterized protein n=2 Tax=Methylococcaceae TaxID=403 RepID=A0ABY2CLD3_METMH|nr:hypothetical protein EDE11_11179 [Methylomonas methanica]